jgi:hypothetical protein
MGWDIRSQEREARSAEYQKEEDNVIAHECAHMCAGGALCGCAGYTYEMKDDGKFYIVAGEVPVTLSTDPSNPEDTVRNMDIVVASCLAPSDPSAQDMAVAGEARCKSAEAQEQINQKNELERNGTSAFDNEPVFT